MQRCRIDCLIDEKIEREREREILAERMILSLPPKGVEISVREQSEPFAPSYLHNREGRVADEQLGHF